MKSVFFALVLASTVAMADQMITCRQITKNGAIRGNGSTIVVTLDMDSKGNVDTDKSKIEVKKLTKDPNSILNDLKMLAINQGQATDGHQYTTLFFTDVADEMLDIQLQFNELVLNRAFKSVPASYVIGSEDANPETGFAFGYDVVCESRVK